MRKIIFILTFLFTATLLCAEGPIPVTATAVAPTPAITPTVICIKLTKLKHPAKSKYAAEPIIPKGIKAYKERRYIADNKEKEKIKSFIVCFVLRPDEVAAFEKAVKKSKLTVVK